MTLNTIVTLDVASYNPEYKNDLEYVISLLKQRIREKTIADVTELILYVSFNQMSDLASAICYDDLFKYDVSSEEKVRDYESVLVISGESGAGKTLAAVHHFPRFVRCKTNVCKKIVFYACRDPFEEDLQKNSWLRTGWKSLRKQYPTMPAKEWRNLLVVLVVDELGNRPELLL